MKFLFIISLFFFISCKNKPVSEIRTVETVNENSPRDFNFIYEDFFKAVIKGDHQKFNKYIHPEYGLYIIESPGALPSVVNIKDIASFTPHYNSKSFFAFDRSNIATDVNHEPLPVIDCDNFPDFWTKKGVFVQETNTLIKGDFWKFLDISEKEKEAVKNLVQTIDVTVVNTNNYSWHFSMINLKWYITFIDMRVPCSA
ncbi:MAG: hypothetical protein M3Q58_15880 [Bacteroidota bacterium]|nr:hypothetical protein [Bacteroidota bacterium]